MVSTEGSKIDRSPACTFFSLARQVKHPHIALSTEVCELQCLVVHDKGQGLAQVDLISSLCDLGNAQKRTLHWANFPDDPEALSLFRSASHRPLASRTDGSLPAPRKIFPDFEAELGFSGIHCIMFSGSAFASPPLSTTAEIFTIPFLLRQQLTPGSCRCHRPTVIREPCHTFRSTRVAWSIAVDFAIFGSPRSIQLH